MAGKLIIDTIQTESSFLQMNVSNTRVATINASGIYSNTGTKMIGYDGTVSATLSANTLANSSFQTGSVEAYMRAQNLDFGLRNRIINGAMQIDQRNAGTAVTPANGNYTIDRYKCGVSQSSKFTLQQDSSANTVAGFVSSLKVISSSAYSITSSDYFMVGQEIEGSNIYDLRWGTANARPVTLSFFVRSSLTGTFGGSLRNNAADRSYPFSYTIVAADTWEQKSITIAGDTSGTWLTTNSTGINLVFGLGAGSTLSGTAGAWTSSNLVSTTGAVSVVGTSGATWYITGIQLEEGSQATPFEFRHYGKELMMCQRYYQQYNSTGDNAGFICNAYNDTSSRAFGVIQFPVIMRTSPTLTVVSATSFGIYGIPANSITLSSIALLGGASLPSSIGLILNASGVTAGQGTVLKDIGTNASGRIQISAEL
jgi:hypothetical protein